MIFKRQFKYNQLVKQNKKQCIKEKINDITVYYLNMQTYILKES